MNIFNIIGPVMIGPSSSHTAGACRIDINRRNDNSRKYHGGEKYDSSEHHACGRDPP